MPGIFTITATGLDQTISWASQKQAAFPQAFDYHLYGFTNSVVKTKFQELGHKISGEMCRRAYVQRQGPLRFLMTSTVPYIGRELSRQGNKMGGKGTGQGTPHDVRPKVIAHGQAQIGPATANFMKAFLSL